MIRRPGLALLITALVAACGGGATAAGTTAPAAGATAAPATNAVGTEITIYAAASLKGALDQAKTVFEAANPGILLMISTDSSSALETKIEQGAPADVFLSADTTNPARLVAAGLASSDPVSFAGNTLVIIVPKGNPAGIASPFDIATPGVKIVAAGDAVPIAQYATRLVNNLAIAPGAPMGFATSYARNVVSKEENVKAVVAKIELGEGDAAIVYGTDAKASGKVESVAITPESANVPATYAGVVVKASTNQAAAAMFLAWLAGPDGQAILAGFGFLPPPA
ncbi:MAG TPA: molybdate ABC transporter substrate-binding protein [Candidatus Limnocylindrales bacterium]|nr:molybdate ABC transporter substrate-binding protein [Candidatus Limnocylindrales bacterium]